MKRCAGSGFLPHGACSCVQIRLLEAEGLIRSFMLDGHAPTLVPEQIEEYVKVSDEAWLCNGCGEWGDANGPGSIEHASGCPWLQAHVFLEGATEARHKEEDRDGE